MPELAGEPGPHASLPPIAYVDTSALVKLVVPEPETDALRVELAGWPRRAASALVRAELVRACARVGEPGRRRARALVAGLDLVAVTDDLLDLAGELEPVGLRTLDAVHAATALSLRDALGAVITYDDRLAGAVENAGLRVVTPR